MKAYKLIIFLLVSNLSFCQVNFQTANSESGIIGTDFVGWNLGYSFSKSEANFIFSNNDTQGFVDYIGKDGVIYRNPDKETIKTLGLKLYKEGSKFRGRSFKIGVPISDGTGKLFGEGNFNPGANVSYDFSWSNDEFDENLKYYFIRFNYGLKENKFGLINSNDSIQIDKRVSQRIGTTFGINIINTWMRDEDGVKYVEEGFSKDNFIIAFTVALNYNINPVTDLKTREFVTIDNTSSNGFIQQTTTAFNSSQEDFFSITPKIDVVWTPLSHKYIEVEETLPRIGIMSSLSSRYNTQIDKFAWNFAIGPSLHPKNKSSQVIAAILAEFNDFNNSIGNKDFNDIFSVSLYVGIPIALKND